MASSRTFRGLLWAAKPPEVRVFGEGATVSGVGQDRVPVREVPPGTGVAPSEDSELSSGRGFCGVIRGRDFCFAASRCRPAMRTSTPNTLVLPGLGFRPAVTLAGCLLAFYCMDLPAPPWASGAGGGRRDQVRRCVSIVFPDEYVQKWLSRMCGPEWKCCRELWKWRGRQSGYSTRHIPRHATADDEARNNSSGRWPGWHRPG